MSNRDTISEERDDDGGESSHPASRPSAGKFSSLLAYLDEASSSHNFCQEVVTSPHADNDSSSSSSSLPCSVTTSRGHLTGLQLVAQPASGNRRLKRGALGKNPVIGSRREGRRSRDGSRVPWDSSIKPKQASARRLTAEGTGREDAMNPRRVKLTSGQKGSAAEEMSCASIANRSSVMMIPHEAPYKDIRARGKEGIVEGDALIHERDKQTLCSGKRVDSQKCSSNYLAAEGPEADEIAEDNGRIPVQEPPPGNGSGRSRRWVWDEWDLNNDDSWGGGNNKNNNNNNRIRRTTVDALGMSASSGVAGQPKPIETHDHSDKPGYQQTGGTHVVHDCKSSRWEHEKSSGGNDSDVIAARQAFEDIQASARAMREELRERRSEVGFEKQKTNGV